MNPLLVLFSGMALGAALMRCLDWAWFDRELATRDREHRRELDTVSAIFNDRVAEMESRAVGEAPPEALEALIAASHFVPPSCPQPDRAKLAERFWQIIRRLEAFREDT